MKHNINQIARIVLVFLCTLSLVFVINGIYWNRQLFSAIDSANFLSAKNAVARGAFLGMPKHLFSLPQIIPTNPTPLISACKSGQEDIIRLLVDNGANVNQLDNYTAESPLLAALHGTKANRFRLATYLIEHGADIHAVQTANSVFKETLSVLDSDNAQTIAEGFALFKYLVDSDVDMTIVGTQEHALTFAARYRNYDVVEYLIEKNYFGVDDYDDGGQTALIIAAKYNRENIVQLLLAHNANAELTDSYGKTALDYAIQNENIAIQIMLNQ